MIESLRRDLRGKFRDDQTRWSGEEEDYRRKEWPAALLDLRKPHTVQRSVTAGAGNGVERQINHDVHAKPNYSS